MDALLGNAHRAPGRYALQTREASAVCDSEHLGAVRYIPDGSFTMGCVEGRDDGSWGCLAGELPAREVTLTTPLWMMEAEVTQAQYTAVVGHNPSFFPQEDLPVEQVGWHEAVAFADAISVEQGLTPCGDRDPRDCDGWRLPTEAEWEYAARGGEAHLYAGGNEIDDVAWYVGNATVQTRPGCSKERNAFGLCDMSGNVWEWVRDWYAPYADQDSTDPTGAPTGSAKVVRGGLWGLDGRFFRAAFRFGYLRGYRGNNLGFRLVRSIW